MRITSLVLAALLAFNLCSHVRAANTWEEFDSPSLAANTWGTDLSDLWVNDSEPGRRLNIAHQGDTLFATFFVYGPDGRAKWYVASGMRSRGGGSAFVFAPKR